MQPPWLPVETRQNKEDMGGSMHMLKSIKLWLMSSFFFYVSCLQLTFTLWILVPLMLPLRSTRNRISLVAFCSSSCSDSKLGQKLSIRTGLLRMSLWYRFLINSSCRSPRENIGILAWAHERHQRLMNRACKASMSDHQPSFRVLNLFEWSECNLYGNGSALHTGWMRACLFLIWPVDCGVLWKRVFFNWSHMKITNHGGHKMID